MASRTIHTLAYKMTVDSSSFQKGIVASKKELNAANKAIRDTATPLEKYKQKTNELSNLLKKGLITQSTYNRNVRKLKDDLTTTKGSVDRFGKSIGGLKTKIMGAAAAYLSFRGAMAAGRGLVNVTNKMDELSKSARSLGTSTEFLTRLQFAASASAGLSNEVVAKGLEKMTKNLSDAATGTGEASDAIKELGLDAKALTAAGPEHALMEIQKAMQAVGNEGDVLRLSMDIFGRTNGKLGLTLSQTTAELKAQFDEADKLGKTLDSYSGAKAEEAAQAIGNVGTAIGGVAQSITIELLPAIKGISEGLRKVPGLIDTAGAGFETMGRSVKNLITSGDIFRGPGAVAASISRSGAEVVSDRARQKNAASNLAKTNARLAAMQKAKAQEAAAAIKKTADNNASRNTQWTSDAWSIAKAAASSVVSEGKAIAKDFANLGPTTTKSKIETSDPMSSISAASSEAFKILNRTTVGGGEVKEMAKTRTKNSSKMLDFMQSIDEKLTPTDSGWLRDIL